MSDKSCAVCIHGAMCLLRRSTAEANQKTNYMIVPNDLAKICSKYKEVIESE